MLVNIKDDIIWLQKKKQLDKLLKDKTTKKNIIWATDAYSILGVSYGRNEPIESKRITEGNADVIKTRARKEFEQQSQRTKQKAEVFTPLWVCRMMNDYVDEDWFGRPSVFFEDGIPTELVEFDNNQSWMDYIDSRRLEITCGEGPYLMSRYDVANGELIPIKKRVGILDRKLRVIDENATTEEEWLKWAKRALEATYGYEYQGDSLLIARVNMVMTFVDYLRNRWNREPTEKELSEVVNCVSWNLWQMDGLTGTIPNHQMEEDVEQISFWDNLSSNEEKTPPCRIYDWRRDRSIEFNSIRQETEQ